MNAEELKAEIKSVLDYNRYKGPVAAFSDGNVFLLLGQEQVNGAVNYAKASGLAIHLVNGDDDDITTIEGLLKVNTFGTRAPATEETAPAADAEPVEDEAAIELRKQQEEQAAADALTVAGGSAGSTGTEITGGEDGGAGDQKEVIEGKTYAMNAKDTIAAIKSAETLEALDALVVGEERSSVLAAYKQKHPELAK